MALAKTLIKVSDNFIIENRTLDATEVANKELILDFTPDIAEKTRLIFPNGTQQRYNIDYVVIGNKLNWNGYSIETLVDIGDNLIIEYFI